MNRAFGWTAGLLITAAAGCQSLGSGERVVRLPPTDSTPAIAAATAIRDKADDSPRITQLPQTSRISLSGSPPRSDGVTQASYLTADARQENRATDIRTEEMPVPLGQQPELIATPPSVDAGGGLIGVVTLDDVLVSVYLSYPLLEAALREREIAEGEQLAAWGGFDLDVLGETLNQPLGFYQTYRQGLGVKQRAWRGSEFFAGYRVGRGEFEPWFLERQTNEGGELKAGASVPVLQDRAIDKERAAVFKADLKRMAAEPLIQREVIAFVQTAAVTYWQWVAAGRRVGIARQLLEIAVDRQEGLRRRVEQGSLPGIELVDNERLIVSRRAKRIEAERKFQEASIKLSLFMRSGDGMPIVPSLDAVPEEFPETARVERATLEEGIPTALSRRPELRQLELLRRELEVELAQARNISLPELDALVTGSQDMGEPTSSKRDKSQFELTAGLLLDVPLQRREARGKIAALRAKLAQLSSKQQFAEQKIVAEVQEAIAGLVAAFDTLDQVRRNVDLARQMQQAERRKLDLGNSNILLLNLRELATAEAELLEVDAAVDLFISRAHYEAAIAQELAL